MNFYDYLEWRGDLSFDRDPINDVDNLLFTYAAYTDLREVIKKNEPEPYTWPRKLSSSFTPKKNV